ncbi:MAG: deoxyuridine 5'-triphosphate nucleotidohydrolase [Chloroflexi bacterium]|nr:deoxyuridine 5'-triphosphate nucleotidohydrolase [Chloroflexota bacterium]
MCYNGSSKLEFKGVLIVATVLAKEDIHRLLQQQPPLVQDYFDLAEQLQPNGFDLTIRDIALFQSAGTMGAKNSQRALPELGSLTFDGLGFMDLMPGPYLVTVNEIVNLPKDIMALGRPRSSLLRCGVTVETAVWDAGYSGRSQSLLVVYNPRGFRLQKNSRIMQLIFFKMTQETDGYRGKYQGENIPRT